MKVSIIGGGGRVGASAAFALQCYNIVSEIHVLDANEQAAAGEALALAKRQGLPLDLTLQILCSGAAGSWMLADRGPRMIGEEFDRVTSAVDIFMKDMSLVLDATRESRFPAALAHAAYLAFLSATARGLGALDDSAVTMHYNIAAEGPARVTSML